MIRNLDQDDINKISFCPGVVGEHLHPEHFRLWQSVRVDTCPPEFCLVSENEEHYELLLTQLVFF